MLGNWINQTTTTTGTGALTLAAVSGFPPASSQFATNERFQYAILDDASGAPLERGLGYLDGSGNLVREKPMAAMVSGVYAGAAPSAVSLAAGVKRVICTPGAQSAIATTSSMWAPPSGFVGYGDSNYTVVPASVALVADRVYVVPFFAAMDSDIDAVMIRVQTAGAGGTSAKGAIYAVGADGLPGVQLAESAAVLVDSIGVKALSFTRFRPPGRYFVALLCDGTPSVQHMASRVLGAYPMGYNSSMVPISYIHHIGATGLVFPSTWTPVENLTGVTCPHLVVRCPV
jgi:hypothetical protein